MIVRPELEQLKVIGFHFDQTWEVVDRFEKTVADFFGAPFGVAVDSCTHALELSFLVTRCADLQVNVPVHTYMSIPMMLTKINQPWKFCHDFWQDYYRFDPVPIIDAAFSWRAGCYLPGTLMCISFQHKKHLPIGRGGMILTDNESHYDRLQHLCRDGRDRKLLQTEDMIRDIGYHYYMTPDDAARGLLLFDKVSDLPSDSKSWKNYKTLTDYPVFSNHPVS